MENTHRKLVSIIMVTWNSSKTIQETLDSIVEHWSNNVELIIIDGESDDGTIDILNRYNTYIHVLVSEKDSGIYDAMNKGIQLAKGRFLYFLGSDDKLLVNLSKLDNILKDDNTVYYGKVLFSKPLVVYGNQFSTREIIFHNICHQCIFYPAVVFRNDRRYDIRFKYLADYALNLSLWNQYKFQYIDLIIAQYNTDGISSTKEDKFYRIYSYFFILKYFGLKGLFYKFLNIFKK